MNKNYVLLKISRCLLVVFMTFGIALAAEAQQGLLVRSAAGTVTAFSYKDVTKLVFQNEIMTTVSPTGVSGQLFNLSSTTGIAFGDVAISALKDTYFGDSNIRLYPTLAVNSINVEGASEGTQASVFSVAGSKIMQFEICSSVQTINVSSMKSGIYLLRISGQTFKFCKQ